LYVGPSNGGILRSDDGGDHWIWSDLTLALVSSFAIDFVTPNTVYAASTRGVLKSSDGGLDWTARNAGPYSDVRDVAVDFENPSIVYAGTVGGGVFKSTDAGETWNATGPGLGYYEDVRSLALDPSSLGTLYAGGVGSISKTTDAGVSWTRVLTANDTFQDLVIDPTQTGTVYAAGDREIYKTTDGGMSWTRLSFELPTVDYLGRMSLGTGAPAHLYVASTSGLFGCDPSRDVCVLLSSTPSWSVATTPARKARLFVGATSGTVLRSDDSGRSWVERSRGLATAQVYSIAIVSSTAYAGTDFRLFQKRPDETNWTLTTAGLESVAVVEALSASPEGAALAGALYRCPSPFPCIAGGGIFKRTEGSDRWELKWEGRRVFCFLTDPRDPNTLYAGSEYAILQSRDGGETWFPAANLSVPRALAAGPSSTLLAGTVRGVYVSSDGGTTWLPSGLSAYPVSSLAVNHANPLEIYAGTTKGVQKSDDGGRSWRPLSFLGKAYVTSVRLQPGKPSIVYIGTAGRGVLRSSDSGGTWAEVNDGMPHRYVSSLEFDDRGARLYAGTYGGGVYEYVIDSKPGESLNFHLLKER
jgi:photosystem II stability/assembly factor-like uncharacterized protein